MRNIEREITYDNGDVISKVVQTERMTRGSIYRELERCNYEKQRILDTVRDLKLQLERTKEEEVRLQEALQVIEKTESEKEGSDIFDDIEI